jgi:hypothetical protein
LTQEFTDTIFAIFAGRSGSGKSAAAASFPKPIEENDFDLRANGIVNAIQQGWLKAEIGKDIHIKQYDPFAGWMPVQEHFNSLYNQVKSRQFPVKTVDIGSLTSMVRLFTLSSLTATSSSGGGLNISGLTMTSPADYKFESQACHQVMDFLRTFPCNVLVSAHIVDRYGKAPGADAYAPSTVVGERLTITANLSENILSMFNDVYRFSKTVMNGIEHFYAEFSTDFAKNSFGLPPGKFEITNKEFYPYLVDLILKKRRGEVIKPTKVEGGLTFISS